MKTTKAAMDMFDENLGLFVSGDSKQVSWVSQSHMILAQVMDKKQNIR